MKDFYYILGTDANCTYGEIREAYRKLSKKFHPDLNPDDEYFESRFREITEAYETLSDPDKRSRYDQELKKFRSEQSYEQDELRFSRASRNNTYKPYKFRSWRPGIGVSVALFLIALVFGIYLIKSFSHSKAVKAKQVQAFSHISFRPHRRHKRKHYLITKATFDSVKHKPDSTKVIATKPVAKAKPDSIKINYPRKIYLYATYVHPNITGVVQLRETDNYSSAIIKTIPANSKVFVLEKGDTYYKVNYNNQVGYVPKWSLAVK